MIARGSVTGARGGLLEVRLPRAAVGDCVRIVSGRGEIGAVITAVRGPLSIAAARGSLDGVACGDAVCSDPDAALDLSAPDPAQRAAICEPFWTGVRALDALLTFGRGARIGLFGAPGAGKSTLLRAIACGSSADAAIVALVGERGREAEEWLRAQSTHTRVFHATSDRSAAERVRAAHEAMAHANALRKRGLHVLVIVDSLARYAAALREIAVAAGEPAGRGGFPASVFAQLACFVEIAGATRAGSITLIATVLSDGDERDPVSDAARSLLDGHVALSSALAQAGRFPAIDIPASASRTMDAVVCAGHRADARAVRAALASLERTADARSLGIQPATPADARACACETEIEMFLRGPQGSESPARTLSALAALADIVR